ncbi:MAG: acyl-CoA dehydrogenase family protein [Solirubrobacteraceae bacterium]
MPIPPFTASHDGLRREIREFIRSEVRPHADEWERDRWFPDELFGWFAQRGYLGLKYPRSHGGAGGDYLDDAVLAEELAGCASGGVAAGIGAHIGIATPPIWKFGSDQQKRDYLEPAIRGERIAALAITEPDAGSDVASIRTFAREVDGGFLVNGAKLYITNGVRADFLVTAVKTSGEGGHHGLSFLIIERGQGVRSTKLDKLGWHASDTAEIAFEDAEVPAENLLGERDRGFYLIMANFQWERLLMALGSVAGMQAGFELTLELVGSRSVGQTTRHALAEVATTIEVGRALTYHALRLFHAGIDAVAEVTMAKLATQRAACDTAARCLEIVGLDPGTDTHLLERHLRDARLGPIGGGTDEIMKEILGKTLGL